MRGTTYGGVTEGGTTSGSVTVREGPLMVV